MNFYEAYSQGYDNAQRRREAEAERADRQEQRNYQRDYASAAAAGQYGKAAEAAGRYGDPGGVNSARQGALDLDEQQRTGMSRAWSQVAAHAEAIDQNQGQGYEQLRDEARGILAQNPNLPDFLAQLIQSMPDQYNPRVTGAVRTIAQRYQENLLTPDQRVRIEETREARAFRERQQGETERHNRVTEGHWQPRAGSEGPPVPWNGYRIVGQ